MRIEPNERGKDWRRGLAASALFLSGAVLALVMGVVYGEAVAVVVGVVGVALFGFFTYLLVNPRMLACMQVVKDDMSYKQLREAIASEDFEQPLHFLTKGVKPGIFLVSDNWVVLADKGNPVYIPKSKVTAIDLMMEEVEFGPEYSGDGHTYRHLFNYFRFVCDERRSYATGLIEPADYRHAMDVVATHFPHIDVKEVHAPQARR